MRNKTVISHSETKWTR